ncbi:MAG: LysR family transcriptional regulator [Lachnospiraceae bacterium]|nr:LysR family transcriptional regulator [Lachnospiraceae bacterium]
MNLRQMEYLLMIVETRNISRAAERCYISQSGMSQQLASIERELGVPVFRRVNNELCPTREGEIYIRYAREILGLHARARREIEECSRLARRRILIGVSPERGNAMMQQILPIFRQSYPDVQLRIIEGHLKELEQMVCDRVIDISEASYSPQVSSSISKLVKNIDLYSERIMLALPKLPYYQKKLVQLGAGEDGSVVDLWDFQNEKFILPTEVRIRLRSVVDWVFQEANFSPIITLETSNNASALNFVAEGSGLSLIPQSYYYSTYAQTDQIYYRAIRQNPFWIRAVIYRRDSRLNDAEKKLVNIIRDFHRPIMEMLKKDNLNGPALPERQNEETGTGADTE